MYLGRVFGVNGGCLKSRNKPCGKEEAAYTYLMGIKVPPVLAK
jgi:hypothetical protein